MWFEHDAADAGEIDQGVEAFRLVPRHLMEVHPVVARLGGLQAQLVFPCLGLRQIQAAGLKDAAALAGFGLQLFVKTHRVMLQPADVGAVMQPVNVRRRVPGGARGQLGPFQEDDIRPAKLGQVVKDGTADKATPDNHGLRVGF